jgi:hypothetical protein
MGQRVGTSAPSIATKSVMNDQVLKKGVSALTSARDSETDITGVNTP